MSDDSLLDPLSPTAPTTAPATAPAQPVAMPQNGELVAAVPLELEEVPPEEVVDAAEALLREGAPHDYEVVVIGAGPGGLACAHRASEGGLSVAVIEAREIGGVCLNRGCIPTKTLLESARVLQQIRRAEEFGALVGGAVTPDWNAVQARKNRVVERMREQEERGLELESVTVIRGRARFKDKHTIQIEEEQGEKGGTRELRAVHVVIATGGRPARLPIPGADLPGVLTSDEVLELQKVPSSLAIIGAGAVGVEFAQLFAEMGSRVILLDKAPRALPEEDAEIGEAVAAMLEEQGVERAFDVQIESIAQQNGELILTWKTGEQTRNIEVENVLLASGRRANIENLGLEDAGIETSDGKIDVDEARRTSVGGVWAIGDCIRRVGWAHEAAREGRAVAEAILGLESSDAAPFVPSCYYTLPEVATVGLSARAARDLGISILEGRARLDQNARAATQSLTGGFVKLLCERDSKRIVGAAIVGARATEIVNEIALAIRQEATAFDLMDALHVYPSFADALPAAARDVLAAERGEDAPPRAAADDTRR